MIGNLKSQKLVEDVLTRDTISVCLSGPEGVGKKTKALEVIGKILNVNTKEAAVHADLFFVEPQNNIIKLEKIRELIEFSSLKSYSGGRKFVVIDDAHTMNIESQNSLLKLIEDPPIGESIILITDKYEMLLPTIRSRVINIEFKKLTNDDLNQALQKNLSPEILALADGSVSKAIKYSEYDTGGLSDFVNAFLYRDPLMYSKDFDKDEFETLCKYTICVLKSMRKIALGEEGDIYDARLLQTKLNLKPEIIDRLLLKIDEAMLLYMGNFNKKVIMTDLFMGKF